MAANIAAGTIIIVLALTAPSVGFAAIRHRPDRNAKITAGMNLMVF